MNGIVSHLDVRYTPTLMTQLTNNGQTPKVLIAAIRRILRPLVRGFIHYGVTFPVLSDLLKRTYVDIAKEDYCLAQDQKPTDSRISLLTRVHRKDIKRFREESFPPALNLTDTSVAAQIIARWLGSANLMDKEGNPVALPRFGDGLKSFNALARDVSKDMHPRVILDELKRADIVHVDSDDLVRLNEQAFLPHEDFDSLAFYFGLNLHDHIAASTRNLVGGDTPLLDRSVHYTGLSAESVDQLETQARELAMEALLKLNAAAKQLEENDRDVGQMRMTFGSYFFAGKNEPDNE